ncbi:MAG: 2-nitropropane dioxygenase [Nitrospirae bacterium CG2_30_53_67]|nr:MAG: 2-nitropropane dioxygenase [Nitrospirae bacterium CG2_30_53_67]
MKLPSLKIKNIHVPRPIIQGGMGVGISWDNLAGNVAKNGCIGIVSGVCTGYRYPDFVKTFQGRPLSPANLHHRESLIRIVKRAKEIAEGNGAVGVNILYCITDYGRVVRDAIDAGADLIISGAGIPLRLPEYAGDADIALIPIVSSARVLGIICKSWLRRYNRLPDAVVMEGPKSGGHQGYTFEQCEDPEYALENIFPKVLDEARKWGDFPVIPAGGIWDRADIEKFISKGAAGVQMATRFIGTYECDAPDEFKQVIVNSRKQDIFLMKSPVGYPARGILTPLHHAIKQGSSPKIQCISNCISVCNHGEKSKQVGFCIADRLGDAVWGKVDTGLFFSGSNGWRIKKLVHVKDLIEDLTREVTIPLEAASC